MGIRSWNVGHVGYQELLFVPFCTKICLSLCESLSVCLWEAYRRFSRKFSAQLFWHCLLKIIFSAKILVKKGKGSKSWMKLWRKTTSCSKKPEVIWPPTNTTSFQILPNNYDHVRWLRRVFLPTCGNWKLYNNIVCTRHFSVLPWITLVMSLSRTNFCTALEWKVGCHVLMWVTACLYSKIRSLQYSHKNHQK